MKLASLFWTIVFSIGVFFAVVYFGIKDNWVTPDKSTSGKQAAGTRNTTGTLSIPTASASRSNDIFKTEDGDNDFWAGSGRKPVLLEEEPLLAPKSVVSLPDPVTPRYQPNAHSQPKALSQSAHYQLENQCSEYLINIGVSDEAFNQAMHDCIAQGRISSSSYNEPTPISTQTAALPDIFSDEDQLLRSQCENAIDQPELLSQEEIKTLVSQCVATLRE